MAQSPVGSLLLSSGSWCAQCFACVLQEWSLSTSPVEVLQSNCPDLQSQVLCRFLVFLPDSLTGKPDIGLRTFTILRKLLWYCCCLTCGLSSLPTMGMWFDFIMIAPPCHLSVASLLSLGMGYHFLVGSMSSC